MQGLDSTSTFPHIIQLAHLFRWRLSIEPVHTSKITPSITHIKHIQVMEVLTHLNKRLKSRPMVQLPVEALLQQYQTTESTFLHNFSIIYITMGFPRLSQDHRNSLVSLLLNCLEGKPENHQDKLVLSQQNRITLPLFHVLNLEVCRTKFITDY